nr:PREDICTED: tribbles homolog 3-like [Lepisosteus oculatus]
MKRYQELIAPYARLLPHENISRVSEVVTGERSVYVFFARSYGDMHSYVRACKRLPEEEAARLFGQMAAAVAHCHEHGVVLRDLKLRKFVFADLQSAHRRSATTGAAPLRGPGMLENQRPFRHGGSHDEMLRVCVCARMSVNLQPAPRALPLRLKRLDFEDPLDSDTPKCKRPRLSQPPSPGLAPCLRPLAQSPSPSGAEHRVSCIGPYILLEAGEGAGSFRAVHRVTEQEYTCKGISLLALGGDVLQKRCAQAGDLKPSPGLTFRLGVVLYTMLVGRYPFQDVEPAALFNKIRRGVFSVPESLSPRAKCLVRCVLRKSPAERLEASEILLHPWLRCGGTASAPAPLGPTDRHGADQVVPDFDRSEDADYL